MKVLAVGDIHCKPEIIDKVWQSVDYYNKIVFIGDYADDWKKDPIDTINTWRKVKDFQDAHPSKVITLIGNHDYAYILGFKPTSGGFNPLTLLLLSSLQNRDLLKWLKNMPIIEYLDGVTYSHAGVDVNWNTSTDPNLLWGDDSPIWNRPDNTIYGPEPQVFGHTPCETCYEVEENIWCIDTFSTYPNGAPAGDATVLEIIDGKQFNVIEIDKLQNDNNNNTNGIKD